MSNLFNFQDKQYAMTPQVKLKKVKDKSGLSPAHRMQFTNDGQNLIVVTDCVDYQITLNSIKFKYHLLKFYKNSINNQLKKSIIFFFTYYFQVMLKSCTYLSILSQY
jgi:hypothetical protein